MLTWEAGKGSAQRYAANQAILRSEHDSRPTASKPHP